jgi:hypothetical protein
MSHGQNIAGHDFGKPEISKSLVSEAVLERLKHPSTAEDNR